MLVALGLAPGCDDIGCTPRPCLNIAEPPDGKLDACLEPMPKDDGKMEPCLTAEPDPKPPDTKKPDTDEEAQPCLNVVAEPPKEPELKPCLSRPKDEPVPVQPCLSDVAEPSPPGGAADKPPKPTKKSGEGMARRDVIERLRHARVLPPDVAARLDKEA